MRGGRRQKGKALEATAATLVGYTFALVSMGTGIENWKLREDEADQWGESLADCARALPSKKFKAVEQLLGVVAPWIGLVGTAAVTLVPRVQYHRAVVAAARERGAHAERHLSTVQDGARDSAPRAGLATAANSPAPASDAVPASGRDKGPSDTGETGAGISDTSRAVLGVLE